jgi:hypothetical protein
MKIMTNFQFAYQMNLGVTNATIKDDGFLNKTTKKALLEYNDFEDLRHESIKMIDSNNYKGLINNLNELLSLTKAKINRG